jgi:hypothetical protein
MVYWMELILTDVFSEDLSMSISVSNSQIQENVVRDKID